MEFKRIIEIIQHWLWLIILGTLIGAFAGLAISSRQTKAYQSFTRVQVMSAPLANNSVNAYFNDQELATTYAQTLVTRPILNLVETRLGIPVSVEQIRIKTVAATQLIDITVEYSDPQKAADIANTLVSVFAEKNNELQASRFLESEQSLQGQIDQVDAQIKALQSQSLAMTSAEKEQNLTKAKTEMAQLEKEILSLQEEIYTISNPPRGNSWMTPTITPDNKSILNEKQLRLDQLRNIYNLYQETYSNLVVLGSASTVSGNANSSNTNLQSTLALYEQIRSSLLSSYEDVRLARLNSTSNIVQIEPAIANNSPIRPLTPRNVGLGAVVGLLIVAMLIFLVEYLDDTIKTADQITEQLNLPVIGYISKLEHKKNAPFVSENPRSPIAEAFRTLRTNIEFSGVEKPIRSLLVVSANPGEGKSTVAANLAVTTAQGGKHVMLIDADLRRPRIHSIFGLANRIGLSDFIKTPMPLADIIQIWKDSNLAIIPSGTIPPNPADLLGSSKMAEVIKICHGNADITIVDAPPFLVADASILASHIDAILLVIHSGKSSMNSVVTTVEQMKRTGVRIIGVVMNQIPLNHSYYYGGYQFYSSKYQGKYYKFDDGKKKTNRIRIPGLQSLLKKKNKSIQETQPSSGKPEL